MVMQWQGWGGEDTTCVLVLGGKEEDLGFGGLIWSEVGKANAGIRAEPSVLVQAKSSGSSSGQSLELSRRWF